MNQLVSNFTKQLADAFTIGENAKLSSPKHEISNVIITGLGGSGIGGSIVADLVADKISVPLAVNKDYFLPAYVNSRTLVIVSSYSGNTEETVNAMYIAIKNEAKIVCITSGGKILELAKKNAIDHIVIPGGMPPRSCLGFSFTQLFFILNHFKLISSDFKSQLKSAITLLDKEERTIKEDAASIASRLVNKTPVIYSASNMEGVAIRFRQQVNENSKMLCWHHVLPEMNHNELVGWTQKNEQLAVILFRNNTDYQRTQKRMEISKEVFSKFTSNLIEIYSKGNSTLEKALYLIHLGDWISCFLAELKKVDPVEIAVIDYLKSSLAKE
jgi:glucose/mannose-6-phosphate isomerase